MGHSVLVVPVPEMEPTVRAHWGRTDPSWVSTDPAFTHAHVTVLSPWRSEPDAAELAAVAGIAAAARPFAFDLVDVAAFPNGTLHAPPEPAAPFAALSAAVLREFGDCVPYGGQFGDLGDLVPHLTLDHRLTGATVASTRAALAGVLPVRCRAARLEWHWYDAGGCAVRASWPLGPGA